MLYTRIKYHKNVRYVQPRKRTYLLGEILGVSTYSSKYPIFIHSLSSGNLYNIAIESSFIEIVEFTH